MTIRCFAAAALLIAAAGLPAQELRITGGIADEQVLQRDARGTASATIAGVAGAPDGRAVELRITRKHFPLETFDWKPVAQVRQGKWSAAVAGIPTGGPYRLEFRLAGSDALAAVTGVLVGDLWVLAGQSNMEGRGVLEEAIEPHPLVHSFDMADHWLVAEEPLHVRWNAADRVQWFRNKNKEPEKWGTERMRRYFKERERGTGLGLPFARDLMLRTGVPVGLIPCPQGGTSMDQWDPALKDKGGDSLYGAMVRRFHAAGGKVKGVLWYQGESDATRKQAPDFRRKFERLVAAIREDFGNPQLPFYYVQIGRYVSDEKIQDQWNMVQEMQREAESAIPYSGMVASIDGVLFEPAHFDAASQKRFGARLANLACHDLFPDVQSCRALKRGPRPQSATLGNGVIRVAFSDVNGRLKSAGRVAGFSIHAGDSGPLPLIYEALVDPEDGSAVLLHIYGKVPENAVVRYGFGTDPYCNLVDDADMAVPVFGPMAISR